MKSAVKYASAVRSRANHSRTGYRSDAVNSTEIQQSLLCPVQQHKGEIGLTNYVTDQNIVMTRVDQDQKLIQKKVVCPTGCLCNPWGMGMTFRVFVVTGK